MKAPTKQQLLRKLRIENLHIGVCGLMSRFLLGDSKSVAGYEHKGILIVKWWEAARLVNTIERPYFIHPKKGLMLGDMTVEERRECMRGYNHPDNLTDVFKAARLEFFELVWAEFEKLTKESEK